MLTRQEIVAGLANFYGTDTWTSHGLARHILMTDGVVWLREAADAYWLIDAIVSYQGEAKFKAEEFQVWTLTVRDGKGKLTAGDGNDNVLVEQKIAFTDFPLDEITFYFTGNVIMLPSEY